MISSEVDRKEITSRPLATSGLSSKIEQEIGFWRMQLGETTSDKIQSTRKLPGTEVGRVEKSTLFCMSRPRVVQTEHVPEVKCSCHRLRCGSLLQHPTEANLITASNGKVDGRSACADLLSCKVACI